ncbi:unnamed protein product [Gongylonema pulchrum]|uniref:EF-hand domain-containing protein n=1 Tax=Gongylonema pulchrum TaxID=637853 RepID=A0A183EKR1_9BILA|nr:unnamed protein product [Gongylonema pulchrum]
MGKNVSGITKQRIPTSRSFLRQKTAAMRIIARYNALLNQNAVLRLVMKHNEAENSDKQVVSQTENGSNEDNCTLQRVAQPKRRVTFSNEVSACPPPEGRDSKKALTDDQKKEISKLALEFFAQFDNNRTTNLLEKEVEDYVLVNKMDGLSLNAASVPQRSSGDGGTYFAAKRRLENIGELFRFSINYTDFPKAENKSDNQCFSLVSIGIDKPIVSFSNFV